MSLFKVAGWDVPDAKPVVIQPTSKKRKRDKLETVASPKVKEAKAAESKRKQTVTKSKKRNSTHKAQDVTNTQQTTQPSNLTELQASMKQKLSGAKFRWINEVMYKSDSSEAVRMVRDDPDVYQVYHTGFRQQVLSWPSNPVGHYIEELSSLPKSTFIIDIGCGDAALARSLVPKGHLVLSYDLVAGNEYVIEADVCTKIPLPGGEGPDAGGQVVDIAVCSLSLMNTNWMSCIREIRRVLKPSGQLMIAEVASRIANTKKFTGAICSIGFQLSSKDESNTHFSLFNFTKVSVDTMSESEWAAVLAKGSVLQPCEYKRR